MPLVSSKNKNNTTSKKTTLISAAPKRPMMGSTILPTEVFNKLNTQNRIQNPALLPNKKVKLLSQPEQLIVSPYHKPIMDLIRKAESNVAGYNTMVGSNISHGLVDMTLQQVMDYQKKHKPGSAAGAYQIIAPTMKTLVTSMGLDPKKVKYDQALQDKMALKLMNQRGLNDYLSGKVPIETIRGNLAKEWAGLPYKGNTSYYKGVGNNQARVTEKEFLDALNKAKALYKPTPTRQIATPNIRTGVIP
jgi:muramidase (phage lysozyme)